MQIENHKEEVPFAYYCEKFAAMDAQEAVNGPFAAGGRRAAGNSL